MKARKGPAAETHGPSPIRDLVRERVKPHAFDDPRLQAVAALVHESIAKSERVSLENAARVARYSPKHFSEYFREHAGLCFTTWQSAVRMKHAEDLLAQKHWMPIESIALVIGYSELSAFSRAFKRYAGISCRQFRWLTRTYPMLTREISAINRLDHAYALGALAHQHPEMIPEMRQLIERLLPEAA